MAQQSVLSLSARTFPSGTFTSPTFTIPLAIARVLIGIAVSPPDVSDPTKSLTFILERQDPQNSSNWLFDCSFAWKGNTIGKGGQPESPSISVDVGPLAGQTCRFHAILPSSLNAAVALTAG